MDLYPKSGNTWVRSLLSYYFFSKSEKFNFDLLKHIPNFNPADFLDNKNPIKSNDDIIRSWVPENLLMKNLNEIYFLRLTMYV